MRRRDRRRTRNGEEEKSAQGGAAIPPMPMEEIAACAGHAEGDALLQLDEGYEASVHAQGSVDKTEDVMEEI